MLDLNNRSTIALEATAEAFNPDAEEGAITLGPDGSAIQAAIVAGATNPSILSLSYESVGHCTGLVFKAYAAAGIYLFGASMKTIGGNYGDGLDVIWGIPQGSAPTWRFQSDILYDLVNAQKAYQGFGVRMSYVTPNPPLLKGDIIFFKNTWQRNKTLDISAQGTTHVGIVLDGPDANGNITFVQTLDGDLNDQGGQVYTDSILNLKLPDNPPNSIERTSPRANAAQLFNGFGTIRNIRPQQ